MTDTLLTDALSLMKKAGYKYTQRREDMLSYCIHKNRYVTAKEVYDYMNKTYQGISFDTIYRNLHAFAEIKILEETTLDGERNFLISCALGEHHTHHHHFICTNCGSIKEIDFCPMQIVQDNLDDCVVESHRFEVYGKCASCSKGN